MKIILLFFAQLLTTQLLFPQSVIHPWHVNDRGGGKSTAGSFVLQSSIGQNSVQRMTSSGLTMESGYIPGIRFVSALQFSAEASWNMISVPVVLDDYSRITLYPTATSKAFIYQSSYKAKDTLQNGIGYWVKFPTSKSINFFGTTINRETLDVKDKWNMIGVPSLPVLVSSIAAIPPVTVSSNYYGYSSGTGYYVEDTLKPGRAYWVKVNNAGKLIVSAGSSIVPAATSPPSAKKDKPPVLLSSNGNSSENINTLTIKDASGIERTVFFTTTVCEIDLSKYDVPPRGPEGIMDVRYATQRNLEAPERDKPKEVALQIGSAKYPIKISWNIQPSSTGSSLRLEGKQVSLKNGGSITILNEETTVKLHLELQNEPLLPKEFALYQNYPNPFNPKTTVRYDVPVAAHVILKIYNTVGQEVTTLFDGLENAGFKSIAWDAGNVASGVYFYRIEAISANNPGNSFVQVRKMLLLK